MRGRLERAVAVLALAAAVAPRLAGADANEVGRLVSRVGEVRATGGAWESRDLERGSRIFEKDVIITGPEGRAKVRFFDKALVELKPDTRFAVERYREKASKGGKKGVLMRLWEGAFRTVTGWIGGDEKEEYKVKTPAATIGIRGTRYAARYCEEDCGPDFRTGDPLPGGLYLHVEKGEVHLSNLTDAQIFGHDRYSYVADRQSPIVEIDRPPGPLFSGEAPLRESDREGGLFRPAPSVRKPLWHGAPRAGDGPSILLDEEGQVIGVESGEDQ